MKLPCRQAQPPVAVAQVLEAAAMLASAWRMCSMRSLPAAAGRLYTSAMAVSAALVAAAACSRFLVAGLLAFFHQVNLAGLLYLIRACSLSGQQLLPAVLRWYKLFLALLSLYECMQNADI